MDNTRANSFPDILPSSSPNASNVLEGVTANVKLLLKLIQDHQDGVHAGDRRQPQRIAGMLTILDEVRSRIETSRGTARSAELRRCNTELRRSAPVVPLAKKLQYPPPQQQPSVDVPEEGEEVQRLRRELAGSVAARKSLEKMFSGVGKEKETIARELAKKVQELTCTEELVGDLRAQNEMLSAKVRACCAEHRWKKAGGDVLLQERNKALSEQLLKSMDAYRGLKRRLKEDRERVQARLLDMAEEAAIGEDRARRLRKNIGETLQEELFLLEKAFSRFYTTILGKPSPSRSTYLISGIQCLE